MIFPVVMLATAGVLGSILFFTKAESIFVGFFTSATAAKAFFTALAAVSVTVAHGHAMVCNGNARKLFNVPHPTESTEIPYLNAGRGYYNLVEHFPFFLFYYMLARESSPCAAGFCAFLFGIGRVLYTTGYARDGPKGRVPGFMLATFASMGLLGLTILHAVF